MLLPVAVDDCVASPRQLLPPALTWREAPPVVTAPALPLPPFFAGINPTLIPHIHRHTQAALRIAQQRIVEIERIASTLEDIALLLRRKGLDSLRQYHSDVLGRQVIELITDHLAMQGLD
jgi:hypothetical protein